jgi:hypothetical protein
MNIDQLQNIETGLFEQAEAIWSTNELIEGMRTLQTKDIAISPSPLVSLPPSVITTLKVLNASQIELSIPNSFDGDRVQGVRGHRR